MSRMPPSFSGGFVCASTEVAEIASAQANAPARTCLMESSLTAAPPVACGFNLAGDHAAWPRPQQQPSAHAVMRGQTLFPLSGMVEDVRQRSRLSSAFRQQPLARHVVDLEANAVGILEQHRVIAGRP